MAHFAGDMDPKSGKPSAYEQAMNGLDDPALQKLARTLFVGFDEGPHSISRDFNANTAIRSARAIDDLIKLRIQESTKQDSF